jgi:DNA-binding LacI/PurR family transcriptional regulator
VKEPRPTLDTVAQAAGVSRMTVSNAYNRPDQISEQTRERVLRVAESLGYGGPDPAARSLRRGRAGTVGVLLTERLPYAFADPGMLAFLHGVATELADDGQALLLIPTESNADHALVRNAVVDAFVLASLARDDPAVDDVLSRRLPVVTWGQPMLKGVPRVGIDNAKAAGKAARHLLQLGHRRFGVVTFGQRVGPDFATGGAVNVVPGKQLAMGRRVAGFVRTLAGAGIDTADVAVVSAETNARAAGAAVIGSLLQLPAGRRPTALFAVTDVLALGVLDASSRTGIEVPTELSVVGFDDIGEAAASTPPLTTISQSLFEQGRLSAGVVIDLLAGREPAPPRITTELMVRASTAPVRGLPVRGLPKR